MKTTKLSLDAPSSPVPLKASVVSGPSEGLERPVNQSLVIGSDPGCDLVLEDLAVSRQHVTIRPHPDGVEVEDLGSTNGTSCAGARIAKAVLPTGSVLELGGSSVAIQPAWRVRELPPSNARRFGSCVAESLAMREMFAVLERVSPTDISVLIEGESGTGKELLSRSIHEASKRRDGPLVVVDCGSIPEGLAESELFGHVKGAFSGASTAREGAFRGAHGGTLFLDEIGELPMSLQPRLLRVLETGEVKAVGSDVMQTVDVRVVSATNRSLHGEVVRGTFRQDLLFRLAVVAVRVPPLRERLEDIGLLAQTLLGTDWEVGGDNLRTLMRHSWPGNVRELRNALQRAVALAQGPTFDSLRFPLAPASGPDPTYPAVLDSMPFKDAKQALVDDFERRYITALLSRHDHNVSRAAEKAQISRKHLHELITRLGLGRSQG